MKWLVFDVESTGLNTRTERIVEFGAVLYDGDKVLHKESSIINPQKVMDEQVIRIHNITNEMASKGKDWKSYATEKILPLFEECEVYAGHNILGFDVAIMESNLRRVGLGLPQRQAFDSLIASRRFLNSKSYRLGSLSAAYGIYIDRAHRALDDAVANAEFILKMAKDLDMKLEELLGDDAVCLGKNQIRKDPFDGLFTFQRR